MAYKKISELAPSPYNLADVDQIEGQKFGDIISRSYTGEQLRAVEKAEREEQDNVIEASVGLDVDGNFIPFSGTHYIDGSETIAEAIAKLDDTMGSDFMDKDTYDPDRIEGDAFDMDNMKDGVLNKILTTQNQSIEGVKNFANVPQCDILPSLDNSLTNKLYVDTLVGDVDDIMRKPMYDPNLIEGDVFDMDNMVEGAVNKILTNEAQKFFGVKDFDKFPLTPETDPTDQYEVANKKYVDSVALGIKGESSTSITQEVSTTGTPLTTSNANKYVKVNVIGTETPTSITLGNMSAKVFWQGTMAEYAVIPTKDANTIYYITE